MQTLDPVTAKKEEAGLIDFTMVPQTSVALGVLAELVDDKIPWLGQNLCALTGICCLPFSPLALLYFLAPRLCVVSALKIAFWPVRYCHLPDAFGVTRRHLLLAINNF